VSSRRPFVPPSAPTPPPPAIEPLLGGAAPPAVPADWGMFWVCAWFAVLGWGGLGALIALGTDTAPDGRWLLIWTLAAVLGVAAAGGIRAYREDRVERTTIRAAADQQLDAGDAMIAAYRAYHAGQAGLLTDYAAAWYQPGKSGPPADPPPVITHPPPAPPVDEEARRAIARLDAVVTQALAYVQAAAPPAPTEQRTQPLPATAADLLAAAYYNGPAHTLVALAHAGQSIACAVVTPRRMSDRQWRQATTTFAAVGVLVGGGERRPYRLAPPLLALALDAAHTGALSLLRARGCGPQDLPGDMA
jgi:hypothetical protein